MIRGRLFYVVKHIFSHKKCKKSKKLKKNEKKCEKICTYQKNVVPLHSISGGYPKRHQKITQLETQKFRDYEQDLQNCIIRKVRDECYQH